MRKRIRQHLDLGLEDVAVPVLVTSHAQCQLFVTAAMELKMAADGDFLELEGSGPGAFPKFDGDLGCRTWTTPSDFQFS